MYFDERGVYISEAELKQSYAVLKANGETDCKIYAEYIKECCGKNGTLTKVKGV